MRLFAICALHDVRTGLRASAARLCALVLVSVLLCGYLLLLVGPQGHGGQPLTWGDFIYAQLGGGAECMFSSEKEWTVPIVWLFVCALCFYVTLAYPLRDLDNMGKQMIVTSGSRWAWWLSKCVYVVVASCVAYGVLLAVALVFSLCCGGGFSLEVSRAVASALNVVPGALRENRVSLFAPVVLMPLAWAALALLQLAISLAAGQVIGFGCVAVLLVASAYKIDGALLGSCLMVSRSILIAKSGIWPDVCVFVSLFLILASVVGGGLAFSRMDILGGERWAS